MKTLVLSIGLAVVCCFFPALASAQGKGKGIGQSVSQAAKNGVHGQQLAALVRQLEAAQGIGRVNGGGQIGVGGPGMMGGGKGGPGMMGGGKGGPGMMGGGKGGPGMMGGGKGGPGMMGGGKGGPGMIKAGKGRH
jgi:hypothetical protein